MLRGRVDGPIRSCDRCGQPLHVGAKDCPTCGTPVPPVPPPSRKVGWILTGIVVILIITAIVTIPFVPCSFSMKMPLVARSGYWIDSQNKSVPKGVSLNVACSAPTGVEVALFINTSAGESVDWGPCHGSGYFTTTATVYTFTAVSISNTTVTITGSYWNWVLNWA